MSILVNLLVCNYDQISARDKIDLSLLEKIDIDRAVDFLAAKKDISVLEIKVLGGAGAGFGSTSGAESVGIPVKLYKKLFFTLCEKISDFLGAEYSDAVFFRKIRPKLGREDIEQMSELIREELFKR